MTDKDEPATIYMYSDLTKQIINAGFTVHNQLGFGFLEKVYHNALAIELTKRGLQTETQRPIIIRYDEKVVGEYYADILVNNSVIVEVKAVKDINPAHEAQLVNYLKATGIKVGLLMNFGESLIFKRKVF
ncbi:MAG: GxxExxY protein [Phycisphaerae bacterium]|jgi:GxxExxY protein